MSSTPILHRRAELRNDTTKLSCYLESSSTKILVSNKGKYLCSEGQPKYFKYKTLTELTSNKLKLENNDLYELTYLGEVHNTHHFLMVANQLVEGLSEYDFLDLRTAALNCPIFDVGVLFYSQGLSNWHFTHRFCAKCGHKSSPNQTGHSRICSNRDCAKEHFPRIEPAVIFSIQCVIDGIPKLLLARQANWPEKRYSVIAGFAEHGESLEEAVAREAMEEVGLVVSNIKYVSSQPWPFPASLMLGFTTETKQRDICLVDEELEHAQWLSAEEIRISVEKGQLLMPFSVSISWHLVDRWYKQQTGESLASLSKGSG